MQLSGKLSSRPPVVASTAGYSPRRLFYASDRASGQRYLIDTGAAVSVVPARKEDISSGNPGPPLMAANGARIRTFGTRTLSLQLKSRFYEWKFIIAEVTQPLLGADFLCHYGLLVDVRNKLLLDLDSLTSLDLHTTDNNIPALSNLEIDNPFSSPLRFSRSCHYNIFIQKSETWS